MKTSIKKIILAIAVSGLMALFTSAVYAERVANNNKNPDDKLNQQINGIHYICYEIKSQREGKDKDRKIKIFSQFTVLGRDKGNNDRNKHEADYFILGQPKTLCVPAIKHECGNRFDNNKVITDRGKNVCRDKNGVQEED